MVSSQARYGLTAKQLELFEFIKTYISINRISPSLHEMSEYLNLNSKSGVHRIVTALEDRGYVRRIPNRGRSIEVVPDGSSDDYTRHPYIEAKEKAVNDLIHAVRMSFRGEDWDQEMLEALDAYDNA